MQNSLSKENAHFILKKLNILYIEDEINIRENVKKALLLLCENVFDVQNVQEAKNILEKKELI